MSCNIHSIPQMSKLNKRDQRPVAASVGICRCQQQSCITDITRTMHWPQQICSDPHNQTDIPAQKLAEEARMSFRNSSKNKHASCRVGVWMLEAPALCSGYLAPLEKSSLIVLKLNGRQGVNCLGDLPPHGPMARVVSSPGRQSWCSLAAYPLADM